MKYPGQTGTYQSMCPISTFIAVNQLLCDHYHWTFAFSIVGISNIDKDISDSIRLTDSNCFCHAKSANRGAHENVFRAWLWLNLISVITISELEDLLRKPFADREHFLSTTFTDLDIGCGGEHKCRLWAYVSCG